MVHTVSDAACSDAELLLDGARYGDLEDVLSALEQRVSADAADDSGRTGKAHKCRRFGQQHDCAVTLTSELPSLEQAIALTSLSLFMQRFTWHRPTGTQTLCRL